MTKDTPSKEAVLREVGPPVEVASGDPVPNVYRFIRLARLILPFLIVMVVVIFEVALEPIGISRPSFWAHLAFYGLLGPLVTFVTLEWIAQQVLERERAQVALFEANRRLSVVGRVLKRSLSAENLEEALSTIAEELRQGTGKEVALTLEGVRAASAGFAPGRETLTFPLAGLSGLLEVQFSHPPGPEEREFLEVLAGEIAGALGAVRSRTRDLLTLYEVDQALRAEANLEKLLEGLLNRILEWAQAEGGGVMLLDEDHFLQPRIIRGLSLPGHAFLPEGGWAQALEAPTFVQEDLLALPLREQTPVGLLLVRGKAEKLRPRVPFLRFLAAQVTFAVRNAQAYLRAEELALAEERNRIAREIHDGIAQALAFMALKLDLAERLLDTDRERALAEMAQVRDTLRAQIREVRRSIFALRPIDLERYGFLESLRRYSLAFAEQAGFRVRLDLPEQVELSQASELVLFRVLQEALTNAAKHARPGLVQVRLVALGERGARLEVRDNGRGFAQATPGGMGGFGLTQMRERVEARGGRFAVESVPGEGTVVRAELPY
ncbi:MULTISPECIES: sensor histidine kinase [unclassified Meiothermus]|uniref:sensor histidine kinase n=1 Tax=unclassified Meiothermus TaxID=370471 RepID=UPI000D7C7524|nr:MULTISPECIES: sensor histidine kinase [unclassified Meiothermus]PZA07305.1 sensor histidine kinase [Meiothermus sp. Pnk-1]RYM29201.1 sensor histidine kinase [Meiothermus sp. PNK-Is4]